jgi:carboxyl-terminal processing protease
MQNQRMQLNAQPFLFRCCLVWAITWASSSRLMAQDSNWDAGHRRGPLPAQLAPLPGSVNPPQAEPQQAVPTPADAEFVAVEKGLELEQSQLWSDAVRHYETESRNHPDSARLYQRLIISRLHLDVNRRFQDDSFVNSIGQLGTNQALDLYSEILANLQTHYVDDVDWARVQLHGTAALEVALQERRFIDKVLPHTDRAAIEQFRMKVHHRLANRRTDTRFDLRANAAYVADLAHSQLGLPGTATVLEYLSGAVSTLDTYTRLLSPSQRDEMFSNIEGNFVGLGVELQTDQDCLPILSVIPGGPAAEAGIVAGEKIVAVQASRCSEVEPETVADMLRGPEFSYVEITVASVTGVERKLNVQRRRVEVPSVENVHFVNPDQGVAYFRITNFQKTTTHDVDQALYKLQRQGTGIRSLIIDVRGNPGGLLSAAVEVADRFIGQGRIVTTRGRNVRENFEYSAHRANTWNVPMAVLIDKNSASASEIFAGAIADNGRGVIVGEKSYGKGSVQGIFRMQSAPFGLCLTTAKFYSPSGRAISDNGVLPTVIAEPTYIAARPNAAGQLTLDTEDAVLQKAVAHFAGSHLISRRP